MRLALDRCSSPRRCGRIAAEVARSFGEWRALEAEARVRRPDGENRLLLHRNTRASCVLLSGKEPPAEGQA
jgi:hypothetical protein